MQLRKKHIKILLIFLSIAMVCIWCYAVYLVFYTYKFLKNINFDDIVPETITSPDKYEHIRRNPSNMDPNSLINHFPLEIPKNAKNVKMSAFPGFMQGGAHFQVRFQLPSDEIDLLYEKYNNEAKAYYVGGDMFTLFNESKGFSGIGAGYGVDKHELVKTKENVLAGTSFHTSDNDEYGFPDDYTIFILDAEPYKPNDWNHGYSRGVVISKEKNDIIYYVEDW